MRYEKGDEIVLVIEGSFGYGDRVCRHVKVQIIGFNVDCEGDDAEYLVYVPPWERLVSSFTLTPRHVAHFGVDKKFTGDAVAFVSARHKVHLHVPAPVGERCDRCNEFFEGAERSAFGVYFCRACTLDPWR